METSHAGRSRLEQLRATTAEIGEVVDVIDHLATRTRLLALNASIESAHAGESGRGFAVVANEVKELAGRTSASTSDVGARVEAIGREVNGMEVAIEGLDRIVTDVEYTHSRISVAMTQQTAAAEEIGRQMGDLGAESRVVAQGVDVVRAASGTARSAARMSAASNSSAYFSCPIRRRTDSTRWRSGGSGIFTCRSWRNPLVRPRVPIARPTPWARASRRPAAICSSLNAVSAPARFFNPRDSQRSARAPGTAGCEPRNMARRTVTRPKCEGFMGQEGVTATPPTAGGAGAPSTYPVAPPAQAGRSAPRPATGNQVRRKSDATGHRLNPGLRAGVPTPPRRGGGRGDPGSHATSAGSKAGTGPFFVHATGPSQRG